MLARSSCGRSSLAGLHPTSTLPARLMTDTVWRRVEDFAVHWADPSSPLYHAVDNVWLEFDVDGPPPDVPVPSIFFAPQSNGQMDDIEVAGEPNAEGRLATVERTIRLLAGGEPPPRMLEGCFGVLSSDEKVFQVGLMLSRGEDAVRLCIRLRSVERIMEYLTVVGWPGDEADLRGVLEPLARSVDRVCWPSTSVMPFVRRSGWSAAFDGNRQPRREPRWGASWISRPERPVYGRQTRGRCLRIQATSTRGAHRALAGGVTAGLATPRRASLKHLRTVAPPRQDRVPAGRTARSQGIPGRQPPLAHARLLILVGRRKGAPRLVIPRGAAVSPGEKAW